MELKRYIPKNSFYRVKANESIEDIAHKFNTTPQNVEILNNSGLYESDYVKILKSFSSVYIVQPLDNLDDVSKKCNVSINTLIESNNLKSKRLFIGQKLYY